MKYNFGKIVSRSKLECFVDNIQIVYDFIRFFTSIRTYYKFRIAISNSVCQLMSWKTSKNNHMNSPDSSTPQNSN